MIPDPADHLPECPAALTGQPPSMVVSYTPDANCQTIMVRYWEQCPDCKAVTAYDQDRLPWRRFHLQSRATAAVWLATWEHRHQLGSRVTRS